jgi:hypothetical protein
MVVIKHLNMSQLGAYLPPLAHVQMFSDDLSVFSPPLYFLSDDLTDLASPEETLHPFVVVDHPGLTAHLSYIRHEINSRVGGQERCRHYSLFEKQGGRLAGPGCYLT